MKSNENKENLTDKQLKAIPHLIDAKTYTEGCKKARITPKTFYQWLKVPAFKEEMKRKRDVVIEDAIDSLKGSMTEAVTALRTLLNTTNNDSLKRYVAKDIIDYVIKTKELEELEQRISRLEEAIKERR